VVLLLAQDSIPVAEGNLEEGDILAMVDILVGEGNLEEEEILVVVYIPVVGEDIPVVVHILVEEGILVVGILEEASVALQSRIEAAHADLHLSHVLLLVVVQGMVVLLAAVRAQVLLLVVRLVVPGCSFATPSRVPDYP